VDGVEDDSCTACDGPDAANCAAATCESTHHSFLNGVGCSSCAAVMNAVDGVEDDSCTACDGPDAANCAAATCASPTDHYFVGGVGCAEHNTCVAGLGVSAVGTADADTNCTACTGTTFSDVDNKTSACAEHKTCVFGFGVTAVGTADADTVCAPCTGTTFSDVNDKTSACAEHKTCVLGVGVSANGTASADTNCTACDGTTFSDAVGTTACREHSDCTEGFKKTADGTASKDTQCTKNIAPVVERDPFVFDTVPKDANPSAGGSTTVAVTNTDGSTTEVETETSAGDSTIVTLTDADGKATTITVSDFSTENVKAIGTTLSTVSVENAKTLVNNLVMSTQLATVMSPEQIKFAMVVVTAFTAVQLGGRAQEAIAFVGDTIKLAKKPEASIQELSSQQAAFVADLTELYLKTLIANPTIAKTLDSDGDGVTDIDELLAASDPFDQTSKPEEEEREKQPEQQEQLATLKNTDSGGDGATAGDELAAGTDPNVPDRDAILDGAEEGEREEQPEQHEQQPQEVEPSDRKPEAKMNDDSHKHAGHYNGDTHVGHDHAGKAAKSAKSSKSKSTAKSKSAAKSKSVNSAQQLTAPKLASAQAKHSSPVAMVASASLMAVAVVAVAVGLRQQLGRSTYQRLEAAEVRSVVF